MSRQLADLHRQLADKLDEIEALQLRLQTQELILETTQEQLRIADTQLQIAQVSKEEFANQAESFRLMAVDWREKAIFRSNAYIQTDRVFGAYDLQDFTDLEAQIIEAKGNVNPHEFDTEGEYTNELNFLENLKDLVKEMKIIKGDFYDGSEGEEYQDEGLKEF